MEEQGLPLPLFALVTPEEQLAAIRSVDGAMTRAGLEYWLIGGWAVDFGVGEITRRHEDVDAAVWRRDEDAIKTALEEGAGWEHHGRSTDVLGTRYELGNAELELTFLESGDDGSVFVPVPDNPIVFPTNPFGDDRGELAEASARLMPLDLLRGGKSAPRDSASDATKDRADFEALARLG